MKKTYKKGQFVKINSSYMSILNTEEIIVEIVFCNNQSLLVNYNKELYEIPEKAISCIVESPVKQKNAPKENLYSQKQPSKTVQKEQKVALNKPTEKISIKKPKVSTKAKKAKHKGNVHVTLVYIPPKNDSYGYSYYRNNDISYGEAHDRAYWSLTHPYSGGGCSPK